MTGSEQSAPSPATSILARSSVWTAQHASVCRTQDESGERKGRTTRVAEIANDAEGRRAPVECFQKGCQRRSRSEWKMSENGQIAGGRRAKGGCQRRGYKGETSLSIYRRTSSILQSAADVVVNGKLDDTSHAVWRAEDAVAARLQPVESTSLVKKYPYAQTTMLQYSLTEVRWLCSSGSAN